LIETPDPLAISATDRHDLSLAVGLGVTRLAADLDGPVAANRS
jgi:hypothetical protein